MPDSKMPDFEITPKNLKSLLTNCIYLEDESVEIFGYKIYGCPWNDKRS